MFLINVLRFFARARTSRTPPILLHSKFARHGVEAWERAAKLSIVGTDPFLTPFRAKMSRAMA